MAGQSQGSEGDYTQSTLPVPSELAGDGGEGVSLAGDLDYFATRRFATNLALSCTFLRYDIAKPLWVYNVGFSLSAENHCSEAAEVTPACYTSRDDEPATLDISSFCHL